jgi:hypothetical protein
MESLQGFKSFVMGPGFIPQILLVLIILTVLSTIFSIVDICATAVKRFDRQTAVVLENTHTKSVVIPQNVNSADDENYPLLYPSVNERNGLEYSFSFHAFIDPESFQPVVSDTCGNTQSQESVGLRHIFSKGNRNFFPLMSPGVFLHADKNTIRVIMNSEGNWGNYVDIPNIPVGKWFHIVISVKGQFMDVYLNGNIAARKEFNSVPKINFGSIYVLQDRKFPESGSPSTAMNGMKFVGAMKGMVSRLHYYAFALNYSQIDSLYRQGPSKKIESPSFSQMPPYFRDEWWVTKY